MKRKTITFISASIICGLLILLLYLQPDLSGWSVVDSALGTSVEDIRRIENSFREERITESDSLIKWKKYECILDKDGALSIYRESDLLLGDDEEIVFQHGYPVNKLVVEVLEYARQDSDERKLIVFMEWEQPIDIEQDNVYLQYFSPEQYLYETQRQAYTYSVYDGEIIVKEIPCEYRGTSEVCLDIEDYRKAGESKVFVCIFERFSGAETENVRVTYRRNSGGILNRASELSVEL